MAKECEQARSPDSSSCSHEHPTSHSFDHGFGVHRTKAANTYGQTPTETSRDDISRIDSDDGELPNMEAKYSARERQVRRELRAIEKRKRDLKDTWKDPHQAKEWNLTFTWAEPTLWQPSAKPRRYGEKVGSEILAPIRSVLTLLIPRAGPVSATQILIIWPHVD